MLQNTLKIVFMKRQIMLQQQINARKNENNSNKKLLVFTIKYY